MIPVTKSFLPNFEDFLFQLKRVYANEWLTNRGQLVNELEGKIQKYLVSDNKPIIMNNGTIPLQIALKLLGNHGEIITTPFSYVATTSSILWENCKPVFVDINTEFLTVDETKIEAAITKDTKCILLTHVFGNPCDVEYIERIAEKHGLFIIYDAAHSFGVKYKGRSIFNWGHISTCSFHATKLFHTGEGGAAFVNDEDLYQKVYYSHNFGHNGPLDFHGIGINGKISEINAAMGLAVFPNLEDIMAKRKKITDLYCEKLNFNSFRKMKLREFTEWNYSYFPIIFETEFQLLAVQKVLNNSNIFPRRYFYPSLNTLPFIKDKFECDKSETISKTVLCLPVYVGLDEIDQINIIELINGILHTR